MISDQVRSLAAVTTALMLTVSAAAQTTGVSSSPAPGIGLSAEHRRTIYREVGQETIRPIPEGSPIAIGAAVPDSLMLSEMPVSVKDQIGLLRDFKFAKVADETIIIVDPAKRQIVDVVTNSSDLR